MISVVSGETECSEMSAYKIQTPGNYSEESIQHSEHGESPKSRKDFKLSIKYLTALQQRPFHTCCTPRYNSCFYMKLYISIRTKSGVSLPHFPLVTPNQPTSQNKFCVVPKLFKRQISKQSHC